MFTKGDSQRVTGLSKLTKKHQDELLDFIQKGSEKNASIDDKRQAKIAKEILTKRCQPVVRAVASKYLKSTMPLEELMKLGNRGLDKAIQRWSWEKDRRYRFTMYATWFIRAEIHKKLVLSTNPEGH